MTRMAKLVDFVGNMRHRHRPNYARSKRLFSRALRRRAKFTDFARDYAAFDAAHETWLPADRRPARTTVGVTALAVAALVETDLVARRPEPG